MSIKILPILAVLSLSACTNPYDPGQRAVGGAMLGAGAGAGLSAITGGNPLLGAGIGGLVGAGAGYVTTPQGRRRRGW